MTFEELNHFQFSTCKVLVEDVTNSYRLEAIADVLEQFDTYKVGIITGVGNRNSDEIIRLGKIAGRMFDEILIQANKDLLGYSEQDIVHLLLKGMMQANVIKTFRMLSRETDAMQYAFNNSKPDSIIVLVCENVPTALTAIEKLQEEEFQE